MFTVPAKTRNFLCWSIFTKSFFATNQKENYDYSLLVKNVITYLFSTKNYTLLVWLLTYSLCIQKLIIICSDLVIKFDYLLILHKNDSILVWLLTYSLCLPVRLRRQSSGAGNYLPGEVRILEGEVTFHGGEVLGGEVTFQGGR